jgi:uncharacterized protein (DUF433 family)
MTDVPSIVQSSTLVRRKRPESDYYTLAVAWRGQSYRMSLGKRDCSVAAPQQRTWAWEQTASAVDWVPKNRAYQLDEWISERLRIAAMMLRDSVTIDTQVRGGVPVLRGTRVPIAQILAEVADDAKVSEIAENLDIDPDLIVAILEGLAIHLDRPFFRQ